MTGCEGYVESASHRADRRPLCRQPMRARPSLAPPPATTALGSLLGHITGGHIETIEPGSALVPADETSISGCFPAARQSAPPRIPMAAGCVATKRRSPRKQAISARALVDLDRWIADHRRIAAAA